MGLSMGVPFKTLPNVQQLIKKKIPSTGEALTAVGLGTWQTFDIGAGEDDKQLRIVLTTMVEKGLQVVDSSPMYGRSEEVVGTLSNDEKVNAKLFMATKVWTRGRDEGINQMNESFRLLRRQRIDLMQVHNLVDWQTHLNTLRQWKEQGKVRYIGITHYADDSHEVMERIIEQNQLDFIQINYSLVSRHAEKRLFPTAVDRGVAVLVNRPFEEGQLFRLAKGKQLPDWCKEFDCQSWGQFFLKFIISHPAVTCAIPGTSKVSHLLDNAGAAMGTLPSPSHRAKMIGLFS
jgi:diketogulonate reductase-like aldo/keto reductase